MFHDFHLTLLLLFVVVAHVYSSSGDKNPFFQRLFDGTLDKETERLASLYKLSEQEQSVLLSTAAVKGNVALLRYLVDRISLSPSTMFSFKDTLYRYDLFF